MNRSVTDDRAVPSGTVQHFAKCRRNASQLAIPSRRAGQVKVSACLPAERPPVVRSIARGGGAIHWGARGRAASSWGLETPVLG